MRRGIVHDGLDLSCVYSKLSSPSPCGSGVHHLELTVNSRIVQYLGYAGSILILVWRPYQRGAAVQMDAMMGKSILKLRAMTISTEMLQSIGRYNIA